MKNKAILIILLMAGYAMAHGSDSGIACYSNGDCGGSYPYCRGDSKTDATTCHTDLGRKGESCVGDTSCTGILVCADLGDESGGYWSTCSDCILGQQQNTGVENYSSYDSSTSHDCQNANSGCYCKVRSSPTTWLSYAAWSNNGLACDAGCYGGGIGASECYRDSGVSCTVITSGFRCLGPAYGCCYDSDCSAGQICSNGYGVEGVCESGTATTTTTTSTVTTTTTGTGTTTTTLIPVDNDCTTDSECSKSDYCLSGFNPEKFCASKKESYLISDNSQCYRNHECLSGKCSASTTNDGIGDYPTYSISVSNPYGSNIGACLPDYFKVDANTIPKNVVIGQQFNIRARVLDAANKSLSADSCKAYFNPIESVGIFDNDTAWAWDTSGNAYDTIHSLTNNPLSEWNYYSNAPYTVNSTLGEGSYGISVQCISDNGNFGAKYLETNAYYANHTTITKTFEIPPTKAGDQRKITVSYKNVNESGIDGAVCLLEKTTNSTMIWEGNGHYYLNVVFTTAGSTQLKIFCSKTAQESATYTINVFVDAYHCGNGVKDGDEGGLDCGGSCAPCGDLYPDLSDCQKDSECESGYCYLNKCQSPTCNDGIKNQGEYKIDMGGPCGAIPICFDDSDCSDSGEYYCPSSGGSCILLNCTLDIHCRNVKNSFGVYQTTTCDTNSHTCKFSNQDTDNGTTYRQGMRITPSTGVIANISGTMLYVVNCEEGNYDFRVDTNDPTTTYYTFQTTTIGSPGVLTTAISRKFAADTITTTKTDKIPELCLPVDGIGGIPVSSDSVWARINFQSCSGSQCSSQIVDVLTYRRSLKSSLNFNLYSQNTVGSRYYLVNATNRSINVQIRESAADSYSSVAAGYTPQLTFNISQYIKNNKAFNVFYYRVNTTFGETYESRYGSPVWMFIEWDTDRQWFKLNFTIQSWMIWIFAALLILMLVYANYRLQMARAYSGYRRQP